MDEPLNVCLDDAEPDIAVELLAALVENQARAAFDPHLVGVLVVGRQRGKCRAGSSRAELNGHEAALLNAVDAIRSLAHVTTPRMQLEVQRDSHPGPWAEGPPAGASQLIHTPETWCRIALLFAGTPGLDASLLTLRRGIKQRGLVELAHAQSLRQQIDTWGGGVEVAGQDPVLVFDDGLGGFLPLSSADVSCRPLSLDSAGVIPVPSTLMVIGRGRVPATPDAPRALPALAAR